MVIKQELIEDFDMVSSPVFPPKFVEIPASPVSKLCFLFWGSVACLIPKMGITGDLSRQMENNMVWVDLVKYESLYRISMCGIGITGIEN